MKILVAIPKPPEGQRGSQELWQAIVNTIQTKVAGMVASKAVERLGEGAWLLLSENGLPCLASALALADEKRLPYRVLVLHESADWKYEPPRVIQNA